MLIAISAKKRHGKDTVADYICNKYGFHKYPLASAFKILLPKYLGDYINDDMVNGINYDREQLIEIPGHLIASAYKNILCELGYYASVYRINWQPIEKITHISVRVLMQTIGTDIGCNQVDQMIWMHPMVKRLIDGENLVISDCRQEHEMDLMRAFGAEVIHVINPFITSVDEHITERGLAIMAGDKVIYNEFDTSWSDDRKVESLQTLHNKIEEILNELKI